METSVPQGAGSETLHTPPKRTAAEVCASAKAAGLVEGIGPVQLLHFSPYLHTEDVKLLEVHGPVLSTLTRGEK